jgi:hypothetical protein
MRARNLRAVRTAAGSCCKWPSGAAVGSGCVRFRAEWPIREILRCSIPSICCVRKSSEVRKRVLTCWICFGLWIWTKIPAVQPTSLVNAEKVTEGSSRSSAEAADRLQRREIREDSADSDVAPIACEAPDEKRAEGRINRPRNWTRLLPSEGSDRQRVTDDSIPGWRKKRTPDCFRTVEQTNVGHHPTGD